MPTKSQRTEQQFKEYGFEYFHDGAWWMFHIHATSFDDAETRIKKLPLAKCVGVVVAVIPVPMKMNWLANLMCWWRSL